MNFFQRDPDMVELRSIPRVGSERRIAKKIIQEQPHHRVRLKVAVRNYQSALKGLKKLFP